jgi:thiol-disulfide isomerase/thioredoxin
MNSSGDYSKNIFKTANRYGLPPPLSRRTAKDRQDKTVDRLKDFQTFRQPIHFSGAPMKFVKASALLAISSLMSLAMAGDIKPFSQAEFDKLTHDGKPVVLDISATWCPTCKAQKPIIDGIMKQPAYKDVTLMAIDFDSAKPTLKAFKVNKQSTLIAFKGDKEVGRSVGDTTPEGLEGLIKKTVN